MTRYRYPYKTIQTPPLLNIKLYDSIQEVPKDLWNTVVGGRSCTFSHEFWNLVECSNLNDFRYRHALFFNAQGDAVALTSFYTITTDIAIFAPNSLRNLLKICRRFYPNFLKLTMLECGTPVILNSPPLVCRPGEDEAVLFHALHELLHNLAKKEGQLLLVIRDFESNAQHCQLQFHRLGYHWVQMLPNTYMDIPWTSPEDYLASMKSYYRSKLRKHLAINQAQGIRHELTSEFHHLADQLCHQWMMVHHQADEFAREKLTPEFYHELSHQMGDRSKALLYYKNDELVGHALLLQDGDLLRWLYFGRETPVNDSLYIYVGWSVVHSAILLGAKQLELGLTTYPIKQDLGAQLEPIHIALRGTSRFIHPLVGWFYPLLNRVPSIRNRNIFKTRP